MKLILLLSLIALVSCSSAPEEKPGDPTLNPEPAKEVETETKGGVLDEAVKNKDCGLFDQFYDGCKKNK